MAYNLIITEKADELIDGQVAYQTIFSDAKDIEKHWFLKWIIA